MKLTGLTLEEMYQLKVQLDEVRAKVYETESAKFILDEVEHIVKSRIADTIATIADAVGDRWMDVPARHRKRIVRVALALLGAEYDRHDHTFLWVLDTQVEVETSGRHLARPIPESIPETKE